jgi:hypothetical protein
MTRNQRDSLKETARDVVNTFTVERDTSLADGAGAPGSTNVGGSAKPTDDDDDDRLRNVRPDEAID